jgi:HSP20 family protein
MAVFRWGQSWNHALGDLEREVDRLLRGVNLSLQGVRFGRQYPALNLYELPDEFLLTAELPGTRSEDLELTVAGGILTLSGKRNDLADVPEHRFRRTERFHGAWQRSVTIPDRVRDDDMTAEFSHGVLKIHLPKAEPTRARQIPVAEGND